MFDDGKPLLQTTAASAAGPVSRSSVRLYVFISREARVKANLAKNLKPPGHVIGGAGLSFRASRLS